MRNTLSPPRNVITIFKIIVLTCVLFLTEHEPAAAQSDNGRSIVFGTVISAGKCHNRFTVATKNGFSILLFIGGTPVLPRDVMDGDMETVGQAILTNKTRASKTVAFVEASRLSNADFRARQAFLCR